jgi:hypothetical protein
VERVFNDEVIIRFFSDLNVAESGWHGFGHGVSQSPSSRSKLWDLSGRQVQFNPPVSGPLLRAGSFLVTSLVGDGLQVLCT